MHRRRKRSLESATSTATTKCLFALEEVGRPAYRHKYLNAERFDTSGGGLSSLLFMVCH